MIYAFAGERLLNKFKITEVGADHTCSNPTLEVAYNYATLKFVSRFTMPSLKNMLNLTPKDILGMVP